MDGFKMVPSISNITPWRWEIGGRADGAAISAMEKGEEDLPLVSVVGWKDSSSSESGAERSTEKYCRREAARYLLDRTGKGMVVQKAVMSRG
mmetsp:Transcript_7511/g.15570  ORF Transcript_7511/g.15570 Transcript_7511/m.15570 type:complete len:92 (-) Transcript_7511:62-337(-)